MKYKITSIKRVRRAERAHLISPLPPSIRKEQRERILFDTLFEISLIEAPRSDKPPRERRLLAELAAIRRAIAQNARRLAGKIAAALTKEPKGASRAFYSGLLLSSFCVCALTAAVALFGFFGRFMLPYSIFTVPSFVGLDESALAEAENCELQISYEYSSTAPAGTVISQTPRAGAERKLFLGERSYPVSLCISAGKTPITVPELYTVSARDARLMLKNLGIPVRVIEEYSPEHPRGAVISSSHASGSTILDGQTLTLRVSLGERVRTVTMPSLFGLSEADAILAIEQRGLRLGTITYQSSDAEAGRVISQQYVPYTDVKSGESVDVTVSLGNVYVQKRVPELYGMSVDEAAEALRSVGLVIGNIYSVSSGAAEGTIISQTPLPSTPINSSITSVDIYVSSR